MPTDLMVASLNRVGLRFDTRLKNGLLFLLAFLLCLLGDAPSNNPIYYSIGVGGLLVCYILIVVLPLRMAVPLLLMLALTGRDIFTTSLYQETVISCASIWQMRFGFIRPSWVTFALILVQLIKLRVLYISKPVKLLLLWFATVPVVTGWLYGGFEGYGAMTEVIIDLKFGLMLLASLVLFSTYFRRLPLQFNSLLIAFYQALLARLTVNAIYFLFDYGPLLGSANRVSLDSAKGVVLLLLFVAIILLSMRRRVLSSTLIGIVSIILLIAYNTRMLWLDCILGLIILMALLRKRQVVVVALGSVVVGILGAFLLQVYRPQTMETVVARSRTLLGQRLQHNYSVQMQANYLGAVDPVRYAEVVNIFDTSWRRGSLLLGNGYGGFFEDAMIPFPQSLRSSYPKKSFQLGKFYQPHSYIMRVLHKHGIVGLILISSLWGVPFFRIAKWIRRIRSQALPIVNTWFFSLMTGITAFLSTGILSLYWSGKGLMINGLLIAACVFYVMKLEGEYSSLAQVDVSRVNEE